MTTTIVWILTVLAAVVIALTRLRLGGDQDSGQFSLSSRLLATHTLVGVVALAAWTAYVVMPDDSVLGGPLVGIAAIGAWWVVALCGLLILMRWLPSRGRHAPEVSQDSWSSGPGLSVLAHVGMVVGVAVFTWAYANGWV